MMDWGSIIGGIGIGSLASSIITQYFSAKESKRERAFNKKEEAYNGLLDALYASQVNPCFANASKIGHWHNRVIFVGSPDVVKFTQTLVDSHPDTAERSDALDKLFSAIRQDLKIDTRKLD